jgi:error-prone DNA polymerase
MVEGKLQIEGDVFHVIVKHCYDLSPFLRELTEVEVDKQPVLTLAKADEKDGYPYHPQNKRLQVRTVIQ